MRMGSVDLRVYIKSSEMSRPKAEVTCSRYTLARLTS